MRTRSIFAGFVTACAALAAGCFSSSSGGNGPDASFGVDSSVDGFGEDSSMEDAVADATADAAVDVSVRDGGAEASPGDSSMESAADSSGLADAPSFEPDAGDAGGAVIRVANMASGLASAIDFCVAAPSTAFAGPYLAQQGVASGIPYQSMSEYATLPAASSFTVRIVAAGASSCSTGLLPDVATGPSTETQPTTVVVAGSTTSDAGAAPAVTVFADDPPSTSPPNNRTRFRVIHEAPGLGPVTIQIGATPYVIPIQTAVPYGATFATSTTTTGAVTPDAQGYVEPNMGSEQVELVLGGVETMCFYVAAPHVIPTESMTSFLVGSQGSATDPLGFVACDELAAPTGHLAACAFENGPPLTAPVRVLHVAPDQSAIDACVQVGTLPYTPGLLATAGVSSGVSFLQITGVLTSVPQLTDVSVALAPAGQPCAANQLSSTASSVNGEITMSLLESQLPPQPQYEELLLYTALTPDSPTQAGLTVASLAPLGGPNYDFFYTENGMTEVPFPEVLAPDDQFAGLMLNPDTYTLRMTADATMQTVYTSGTITFAANQTYLATWFDAATPSPGAVAVCPLDARAATTITTCTD